MLINYYLFQVNYDNKLLGHSEKKVYIGVIWKLIYKKRLFIKHKKDYRESFLVKEKFTVILTEKLC